MGFKQLSRQKDKVYTKRSICIDNRPTGMEKSLAFYACLMKISENIKMKLQNRLGNN